MSNRLLGILTRIARPGREPHAVHYHDVAPLRYHFALRLKRRHRNRFKRMSADEQQRFIAEMRTRGDDVSAFETDPRERLVQFLRDFGQRTFGSSGTLESLILLEYTTDSKKRGCKYVAVFGSGTRMIWAVALGGGRVITNDGANAPA